MVERWKNGVVEWWSIGGLKFLRCFLDVGQNGRKGDFAALFAGGDERGERFGEVKGVDFIAGQVPILKSVQQFHIGSAAGTKGFHGQRGTTALAQMMKQQSGEKRLADAGVSAGDEDKAWGVGALHASDLSTDGRGGIQIKSLSATSASASKAQEFVLQVFSIFGGPPTKCGTKCGEDKFE